MNRKNLKKIDTIKEDEIKNTVIDVAKVLRDGKAFDIKILDLRRLTTLTDYFIICTATSTIQIKALVREIEEFLFPKKIKLLNSVDSFNTPWVLLDFNFFVVHIFLKEGRDFYQLERLWADADEVIFEINRDKNIKREIS